jgi:hypothetical protein
VILILMSGLALLVTTAQQRVVRAVRVTTPLVKRFGGLVLVLVGLWFLALAIWADFFATVFPV